MLKRGLILANILILIIFSSAFGDSSSSSQQAWKTAVSMESTQTVKKPSTSSVNLAQTVKKQNKITASNKTTQNKAKISAKKTPSTRTKTVKISAPKTQAKPQEHLWNLHDVDILKVISEVSSETGKSFIVDPQVSGKVTIISNKKLSSKEIYQVFLSTLQVLGYAALPSGKVTKIVPLRDAGRSNSVLMTKKTPKGDNLVIQVFQLHYISATQLVPLLNPMIPTWASVSAVTTANSLIVSGTSAIIDRIKGILHRVDTPSANGVDVVPLKYALADDVAKELNQLIQASRAYGETVNAALTADDHSNSILLTGNGAARLRLKLLITELDKADTSNGLGDTQVIHLRYIQVQDILPILRGIAHQSTSSSAATSTAIPVTPMPTSSSTSSTSGFGSSTSTTNQTQTLTNSQLNSGAVSGSATKQQVVITGDVTNNALIITAPSATMLKLKSVISRLDVRPMQVLVQGVIAEVDASKIQDLGIHWGTRSAPSAGSDSSSSLGPTTAFSATGGVGVGFLRIGDLRALIQALGSDTSSNILSTPSITVLNNGHANIEVGKTISETTGQYQPTGNSSTDNPYVQYQDKNVGLTLKVTPQITDGNSVRLAIDQSNSSVLTNTTTSSGSITNPNPSTNQEKISTSVLVNNGQVLVLGGLMNSLTEKVETKVPILGDIPLLGWFFRHTENSKVKKDLLIFLRPVVISNTEQATRITNSNYSFIRDRQILNNNNLGNFTASSVLMSPGGTQLPLPFTYPKK